MSPSSHLCLLHAGGLHNRGASGTQPFGKYACVTANASKAAIASIKPFSFDERLCASADGPKRPMPDSFAVLWVFNGLQAGKFRCRFFDARAARGRVAGTAASRSASARDGPGRKKRGGCEVRHRKVSS
jgi:hypothetical protein